MDGLQREGDKTRGIPGVAIKVRALCILDDACGNIRPSTIGIDVGFAPLAAIIDALRGRRYPGQMGQEREQQCGVYGACGLRGERVVQVVLPGIKITLPALF